MGLNFLFFWCFHGFLQFGQNLEKTKKAPKKKFRPMGKVWGVAWQGTWV
jgi:amino acid transporter